MRSAQEEPSAWSRYGAIALLVTCVFVLFGRILGHPFIAFDDFEFILRNPQVTHPGNSFLDQLFTPEVGYIVPVTVNFEAFLNWIGSGRPWIFHGAALLLHAVFVVQLFMLGLRLTQRVWLSTLTCLLFALHPLVVEPVSWAICLKDLLMANLALAATRCFLSLATRPPGASGGIIGAAGAVGFSILAMFAKPSAVLLGWGWLGYLGARWIYVREDPAATSSGLNPAAIKAAGVVVISGMIIGLMSWFSHNTLLGNAVVPVESTLATPLLVLGEHVLHILWPVSLHPLYSLRLDSGLLSPGVWLGIATVIAWLLWVFSVRKKPRWLLFPLLAAAVYLPVSGVLSFNRLMSDSYMYFPLAMLAMSLALWLVDVLSRVRARWVQRVGPVVLILAVGLLALRSSKQIDRWQGGAALWAPVIQAFPGSALANFLAADEYFARRQFDDAVSAFRQGYQIKYAPEYLAEFGMALLMARKLNDAECVLIEAIYNGDDFQLALFNYAMLLYRYRERAPVYPEQAAFLLSYYLQEARAGRSRALPGMVDRLTKRVRELGAKAASPPNWPVRSCVILHLLR